MMFFVAFEPEAGSFRGHLSLEAVEVHNDLELLAKRASNVYRRSISKMRKILFQMEDDRKKRKFLYARTMWDIGNAVFELRDRLAEISLEIDGMYGHLERDLGIKQKWLEKVIILRRYIEVRSLLPQDIPWSRFEHSTRKKAERLAKGLPIE